MTPPSRTLSPGEADPEPVLDYAFLLNLSEDEIYSARKSLLRKYFLALQSHARNPQISTAETLPQPIPRPSQPDPLPRLLNLPPEILSQIAHHLLTPCPSPIPGPHPRTLQTPITLTCRFPPSSLLICRQLHTHFLPIFYGSPCQEISITIDYNLWHHRLNRSTLALSSAIRKSIRYLHITVFLGNEKRNRLVEGGDREARLEVVKKGVRKVGKWLGGSQSRVRGLRVSWFEPPSTFTWGMKREVLDLLRGLRAESVVVGVVNWGLRYPGGKYAFKEGYLGELEWREGCDGVEGEGREGEGEGGE